MAPLANYPPKMNQHMFDVMASMGWDEKAFVPIANETNTKLMASIRLLQEEKAKKSALHETLTERVAWLKQHIDNCNGDIARNLKLISAHRQQLETEQNMCKVAQNEEAAHKKEMQDTERQFDDLKKRSNFTEDEIEKLNGKIDHATSDINWMRVAVNEWHDAMKNGEEINAIMDQYSKEDRKKFDTMETKRRNVEMEVTKHRHLLHETYKEQKALEKVLDNTGQMYQQTHLERQELISTWRKAVNELHSRETIIRQTIEEIDRDKKITEEKREELAEQNEFLEQQIKNNKETEFAMAELNKHAVVLRNQNVRYSDEILTAASELMTLKKTLRSLSHQLQQVRQKNRHIQINIEEKIKQIETMKNDEKNLDAKINKFTDLNMSANDRLKSLDDLVEAEEKAIHDLAVETTRMCGVLYRSQQLLQQWHSDHKLIQNDIHLLEKSIKSIVQSHSNYEKELRHQTEIMYDVNLKLLDVETRVSKMKGAKTEIDPEALAKLQETEKRYEERQNHEKLLRSQMTEIQDNIRKLKILFEQDLENYARLEEKLKERQIIYDGTIKQLAKAKDRNHEKLVDNCLMKMKVHQMEERENRVINNSFNMEKHKCQLELAINERLVTIQTEINMLMIRKKLLNEERSQLKADIADRNRNIDAMKARFELSSELLGRTEDGEIISTIQLKIQTAQEKEMLLDQGSLLNEQVIQAEKDITALENTLIMMNYSNDKYKRGLQSVDYADEDELAQVDALNDQLTQSQNQLKILKANIVMKTRLLDDVKNQCGQIENDLEDIRQSRNVSNDDLMKIHNEIFEQKSKRQRAEREMKNARKAMVEKIGDRNYISCFEKDIKSKELEERNTSALQQLSDMVDSVMGLGPVVTKHLYEKGLQMPPLTGGSSLHSASSRGKSDRSAQSLRRQSQCSDSSSISGASSRSIASTLSKTGRTIEKRASVVTIDFPGDDSFRSSQTGRGSKRSS